MPVNATLGIQSAVDRGTRVSILSLLCDDGLQTPVEEGREINCLWLVGDIHSYVLCVSAHN